MTVRISLKNGNVMTIFNARWHPPYKARLEPGVEQDMPAGAWVFEHEVAEANRRHNEAAAKYLPETCRERTMQELYLLMEGAELPLEILRDSDNDEPWRDFGNAVKSLPYCASAAG